MRKNKLIKIASEKIFKLEIAVREGRITEDEAARKMDVILESLPLLQDLFRVDEVVAQMLAEYDNSNKIIN